MPKMGEVNVYVDASFADGVAGIAAVMNDGEVEYRAKIVSCRGSNQAEFLAAMMGARMARRLGWPPMRITIVTDSQLLMKQFKGLVKVRSLFLSDVISDLQKMVGDVWWEPDNQFIREADSLSKWVRRRPHANS